MNSTSSSG